MFSYRFYYSKGANLLRPPTNLSKRDQAPKIPPRKIEKKIDPGGWKFEKNENLKNLAATKFARRAKYPDYVWL